VPSTRRIGLIQAIAFLVVVLAYLWLLVIPYPWTGAALILAVAASWWRRSESVNSLGLGWRAFLDSFRRWRLVWIACIALFVILGGRGLVRLEAVEQGLVYFGWSAAQQLVYQSMIYAPLRRTMTNANVAVGLSGVAFALAHAPNPILVPATLLWGAASCLLFERCRSIWGLALLQLMLSSMLFWVSPPGLHRNFTIGPYYFQPPAATFAPPIGPNVQGGR
jgi:hypothetical protein